MRNNKKQHQIKMSKRNNNFRREEQPYGSNKKPKGQAKSNSFRNHQMKYEQNVDSKQVESRLQYVNFKQQSESNIDRLDLIFQKQPKEIQDKLMKLLIRYNAILQYNRNTDLFQVDLLLPFLSEEQKKEFVKQFLEIRRNKVFLNPGERQNQMILQQATAEGKKDVTSKENLNQSKEIRKFSFNGNMKLSSEFQEQIKHKEEEMMDQLNYQEEHIQQQKNKIVFLADNNKMSCQHPEEHKPLNNIQNLKIDLKKIEQSINSRLQNAIKIINRNKAKQQNNKENQSASSLLVNQYESRKEESIIQRYQQTNHFADSQKISEQNSNYIKEDIGQIQQPSQELFFMRKSIEQNTAQNNYQSQTKKYGQIIEQQQDEEDYEPLFKNNNKKSSNNDKITSFEDYTKRYTTLKQDKNKSKAQGKPSNGKNKQDNQVSIARNYFTSKEKDKYKKSQKQFDLPKTNNKQISSNTKTLLSNSKETVRSRQSSSHSQSISSHQESPSKQSVEIKQNINEFFNQHRLNLQSLYTEIRSKIKSQAQPKGSILKPKQGQKQKAPQKLSEEDYILVLDDLQYQQSHNTSASEIPNSQQFKSQIIKQYKNQILVDSNNLSSEDLIRYFKFLHSNAKKLYIKYLRSKK